MRICNRIRFFEGSVKLPTIPQYDVQGYIGKGSTSQVFQGEHSLSKKPVIIKVFKDTVAEEKIKRQIRINQIVHQSSHVVPMKDVIRDDNGNYCIIFHNFKGVTLNHLIGKMDEKQSIGYLYDSLLALRDLHSLGIIHCDLKPSNILITKEGAKVFDFGLSRQAGVDELKVRKFGTKCYYSPQVMFRWNKFNQKIDIWLLGLIFAQMICKRKPLMPFSSEQQTKKQIIKFSGYNENIINDKKLKVPPVVWYQYMETRNSQIVQVIQNMMKLDPHERPSANELLLSPIFQFQ